MKTSITIIGSCVSNMVFRYNAKLGNCPFLLKGCTTLINPFTLGGAPVPNITELLGDFKEVNNVHTLSRKFSFDKCWESVCRGKWLVVDLAPLSYPILEFVCPSKETYYLSSKPACDHKEKFDEFITDWAEKNQFVVKKIANPLLDYPKEKQVELIRGFAEHILKFYDPDHVILFKVRHGTDSITSLWEDTLTVAFSHEEADPLNQATEFCEEIFCKEIGCKRIIESFENIILNDTRKLHVTGSSMTHYDYTFYEYGNLALDIATDEGDIQEICKRLEILHEEYAAKFEEKYRLLSEQNCEMIKKFRYRNGYEYYQNKYIEGSRENFLQIIRKRYNIKNECPVRFQESKKLDDYIRAILNSSRQYVLFLSVRETANKYWKNWKTAKDLGLTVDLSNAERMSYCAIVDLSRNYSREGFANSSEELTMEYKMCLENNSVLVTGRAAENAFMPEVFSVFLSSKGKNPNMPYVWSRIMINNIDWSINKTGMNFVVFSLKDLCVVDSFFVNFWKDSDLKIYRK